MAKSLPVCTRGESLKGLGNAPSLWNTNLLQALLLGFWEMAKDSLQKKKSASRMSRGNICMGIYAALKLIRWQPPSSAPLSAHTWGSVFWLATVNWRQINKHKAWRVSSAVAGGEGLRGSLPRLQFWRVAWGMKEERLCPVPTCHTQHFVYINTHTPLLF